MRVRIKGNARLSGNITVPASKSLLHRAIIASSLAEGKSIIRNVSYSSDIDATIAGMEALGSKIIKHSNYLEIYGSSIKRINNIIDANESGSTLRFLIPIAMVIGDKITFTGRPGLSRRPLEPYFNIFKEKGIKYSYNNSPLPLEIENKLTSGVYNIRGDISSQFITGLLFSLPLLEGDSILNITAELESKGYIDLTLAILKKFGIEIINNSYRSFIIRGGQKYKPTEYICEGDYSQAAFYLCMNALGSNINIANMNSNSYQGDMKILEDLRAMGSSYSFNNRVLANTMAIHNTSIALNNTPDLGPALAALMSLTPGRGMLINASRLRLKESDRIASMEEELSKLGIMVSSNADTLFISGSDRIAGGELWSHNDHRIAMALSMLAIKSSGDIIINEAECVNKSYPGFWEAFKSLGGEVSYE